MERDVLVTGGTGSIGQSIVRRFSEEDDQVMFQYNSDQETADELESLNDVTGWQADFTNEPIEFPDQSFDVLVNSAGVNLTKTYAEDVSNEELEMTLQINLEAPFKIIREYLPTMVEKQYGRIINVGSIYSLRASEINSAYNISKHGLTGLTRSIAKEYASEGITCNQICPAAVESDLMEGIASRKAEEGGITAEEYLDKVRTANPMNRMAFPTDIASTAFFLASDDAEFINGESVVVDGGQIC